MKNLKDIIFEKLIINKDMDDAHLPNEEVLILEGDENKLFDRDLFITGLEDLNKKHPNSSLYITVRGEEYLDLASKYHHSEINIDVIRLFNKHILTLCIFTYDKSKSVIENKNGVELILKHMSSCAPNIKTFKIGIHYTRYITYTKYMYVWYSLKDNVMRIDLSDEDYKKLVNDHYFD